MGRTLGLDKQGAAFKWGRLPLSHKGNELAISVNKPSTLRKKMRPEWSDFGFTVCYSNLIFLFDANA